MPPSPFFVYIVRCADGSLYTGCAKDPVERADVHNSGRGAKYTAGRCPVQLVYTEGFASHGDALRRERQLKRWPRRKKEALVAGDLSALKRA
jgi:predicted GIY-YIG superfamily endonuclease